MLGAFVIGFLSDGLVIIGVSAYWQTVFTGAVIVLAVLLNCIQYGRRVKSSSSGRHPNFSAVGRQALKGRSAGKHRRTGTTTHNRERDVNA